MTALDVIPGTVVTVSTHPLAAPEPPAHPAGGAGAPVRHLQRPSGAGHDWDDARALTDTVAHAIATAQDWADIAAVLILRARRTRADVALGYPTWVDYVVTEFAGVRDIRIPPARRQQLVAELRAAGLVLRDIAAPLGITEGTVRHDLAQLAAATPAAAVAVEPSTRKGPVARTKVARLIGLLEVAGPAGLTARELRRKMRDVPDPGAILSELHARHLVERISVADLSGTRDGFAVYVLPAHVDGRDVEQPGRRSRRRVATA